MFASSRLGIRIFTHKNPVHSVCRILLPSVADSVVAIGSHFGRQTFIHIAPSMWIVCEHTLTRIHTQTHPNRECTKIYRSYFMNKLFIVAHATQPQPLIVADVIAYSVSDQVYFVCAAIYICHTAHNPVHQCCPNAPKRWKANIL